MPEFTYVRPDGSRQTVTVATGTSAMQAALLGGITGIIGECGGQLVCATCHVYVQEDKLAGLPGIGEYEAEMLECTASPRKDNSRLSCQIVATEETGHLTLWLPEAQS